MNARQMCGTPSKRSSNGSEIKKEIKISGNS